MSTSQTAFLRTGEADVAVLIVTYNSADDVDELFESLRAEADGLRLRVIVADNDSRDDTLARVGRNDDVVIVATGGNLGYAAGVNAAARHAGRVQAHLVLNPDLRVEPGAIRALLDELNRHPDAGIVVPRLRNADGTVSESLRNDQTLVRAAADAVLGRHWRARPSALSEQVRDTRAYETGREIEWATGAAMMIGAATAQQVGDWDESFFLFSEETDYFRRARAAGWKPRSVPAAEMEHRGGGSGASDDLVALTVVNRVRYMDKHRPRSAGLYRAIVMAGEALRKSDRTHDRARWALARRSRWAHLPSPSWSHTDPDALPPVSIIVPAHNEAAVIARTLAPLAEWAEAGGDVIVVCNACTDATAQIARGFTGVRVIELPIPSKAAALRAGDDIARHWPRVYLDADIVVTPSALSAVVRTLRETEGVLAARPTAVVDTTSSDRWVRAYYRARSAMPALSRALWGAGVYALSEDGHARFGAFPSVTADDLFVDLQFSDAEKRIVPTIPVVVSAPRTRRDLLSILSRSRRGPAEQGVDTAPSSARALLRSVRGPGSLVDALVYAQIAVAARRRGNASAGQASGWERDDSSRTSATTLAAVDAVILTRFNLPTAGPESLVRAQDGWLRNRVDLFERYTVPSVRAQSVAGVTWIVYFDTQSPEWLIERLRPFAEEGLFTPLYRDEVTWQDVAADAREVTGASGDVLLTTNLDNDDALAVKAVARLQALARDHQGHALFLRNGLIRNGDRLYLRRARDNAFCSLSESWQQPVTAWRDWHTLLRRHFPTVNDPGEPGWLQVIHGQNVSNTVHGRLVSPARYEALFPGLLDGLAEPSLARRLRDGVLEHPLRESRTVLRRVAKNIYLQLFGKAGLDSLKARLRERAR